MAVVVAVFLLPFSLLAAPAADPPGPPDSIEQIVVVANKDERSIRNVAASVTALSRNDLNAVLAASMDDAFRYVPGVDTESAGLRFGSEAINIRGIGGNRVATLLDGVPLSDQFDIGSFSNATRDFVDTGLVESIEVLHGPASALYGSSAIGGVVAMRTPNPGDIGDGEALLTWRGADASFQGQTMVSFGAPDRGLLLGASWRDGQQPDAAAANAAMDRRDYARHVPR
jgi:hemoglobin/transferrin/lactoferrin receptor protein